MNGAVLTKPIHNDLYQSFIECGNDFRKKVTTGVQAFFRHVTLIKDDSDQITHLWKVIPSAMIALSASNSSLIHKPVGRAIVFLEGVQLFGDLGDVFSGKLFKETWGNLVKRVSFIFANLGTTVVWANELGFITLGSKLLESFTLMANGGAAAGFLIGAGKSILTLATLKDHQFKTEVTVKALLDLISSTAGAALPIINIIGITICPVGIALLVITSSGFGLLSFCYKNHHENAFEEPKLEGSGIWSDISHFINNSEGLEKVVKLFSKLVEETSYVAFEALAADGKNFVEFHEVLKLPQSIKGWICPDERDGRFIWEKSIWKIGDLFFKTCLGLVTAAAFSIRYKMLELSAIASATIGGVAFLAVAPLTMIFGFSTCGLIENSINMVKEYSPDVKSKAKKARANADAKLEKWIDLSKRLKSKNTKVLASFEISKSINKHAGKLEKQSVSQAEAFKQIDVNVYASMKVKRIQVRHDNACHRCHKYAITILNDLGKVLGTSLGVGSLIAATTVGGAATAAALGAAAGTFAVAGGFVGVFKFIYDKKHSKEKSEPEIALPQRA